jgi:hypothetical protein
MYRKSVREFLQKEFMPFWEMWLEQHQPRRGSLKKRGRSVCCFRKTSSALWRRENLWEPLP